MKRTARTIITRIVPGFLVAEIPVDFPEKINSNQYPNQIQNDFLPHTIFILEKGTRNREQGVR
jgi:hypothetical protein